MTQISPQDINLIEKKKRGIPAWMMSFCLHGMVFVVLIFTIRQLPRGTAVEGDREAGIVLVDMSTDDAQFLTEGELTSSDGDQSDSTDSMSQALPSAEILNSELEGILPSADTGNALGEGLADGLPGVEGLLNGDAANRQVGGQVSTKVFGIEGTGRKFVYVFDRSLSMTGFDSRPLRAAKEQLIASIKSLGETHQFQIIFYNQNQFEFAPIRGQKPQLMFGTAENKNSAVRFIQRMTGDGGTSHFPALQKALFYSPDVIFFLTDAEEPGLNTSQFKMIIDQNRSAASINAIEFGAGPRGKRNNFLVQLARAHGGQYVYKDVTLLGGH